ncbi:MAG: putative rane protein [Edaphobacter sp.]|nr:putative rane protein [Edaphobacter sp.]
MQGWKRRDLAVWLAYLIMLAFTVPRHEPWNDEAQAWLLARDLSLPQLLSHGLRYESHPPLWYVILWIPSHLHIGYFIFCWISAAIAAAGIYVLLRLSPFPFYLRAILPFSFYLAYQYSVVARSYVLFPLLCFLVAHAYRQPKPRPVLLAIYLALLANVSIHGTLVACLVAAIYGWNHLRPGQTDPITKRSLIPATLIFAASVAVAGLTIFPLPHDLTTVTSPAVTRVLLGPQTTTQYPAWVQALPPSPPPAPSATQIEQGGIRGRLASLPRRLSYSISSSYLIAFALYALVVAFLYARGQLLLLLPLGAISLFFSFVYARSWHLGLIWVTLLMILWAAWDPNADASPGLNLQKILGGFLFLVCLLQLSWTWRAIRYDIDSPYSGAKATAAYLLTLPSNLRIAAFGPESTAVVPYFSRNIFFNQPTAFWLWSTGNTIDIDTPQTVATHPDLILLMQQFNLDYRPDDNPILDYAQINGYQETHRFCGSIFMHEFQKVPDSCYLILQPTGLSPAK